MNSSRPNSVTLAVYCLIVSAALSQVQMLMRGDYRTNRIASDAIALLIVLFLALMIYWRKNWARWIFAGCVVLWLVMIVAHLHALAGLSIIRDVFFAVQLGLWMIPSFLLFAPSANAWFRIHDED